MGLGEVGGVCDLLGVGGGEEKKAQTHGRVNNGASVCGVAKRTSINHAGGLH